MVNASMDVPNAEIVLEYSARSSVDPADTGEQLSSIGVPVRPFSMCMLTAMMLGSSSYLVNGTIPSPYVSELRMAASYKPRPI